MHIQQVSTITSEKQAISLFITAMKDFTERVKKIKLTDNFSIHVHTAIKYINTNPHEKISITSLAKKCNVTPQYLSSTFHRELNVTINEYIRTQKLKIAAQMLEQSNYSIKKITNILNFSSQSAFTSYFKAAFGLTPNRYRSENKNKTI